MPITRGHVLGALLTLFALTGGCAPGGGEPTEWEETEEGEDELRVCADGPTVKGIDVSYWQEEVDWQAVRGAGVEFAFVRLSYGEVFKDPRFEENWARAKEAGLIRGAYQYFRPEQDPLEQAQLFLDSIAADPLGPNDLPAVLDVEQTDGLSNATVRARMQVWLDAVEAGTGKRPIIYSAAFMENVIGTGFSEYPLWVANYTSKCPRLPNGWGDWVFWQSSESGKVAGVQGNVDIDHFNGTRAQLLAFASGGAAQDPGDPQDPPEDPPANAPVNLKPADGSHVTTDAVTLSCDPFAGAKSYSFQIDWFSASTHTWKPYYTYSTTSPAKTFWPVVEAPLRFRVKAALSSGSSDFSAYSTFAYGDSMLP
jgi:GH25 family lysozyme M1 (1,4-beta-N-acetylmuramidase)